MIWMLLAPIDMMVALLAFPLSPFIVLFTSANGHAPRLAWPWMTYDNTIDGDSGHLARWAGRPVWMRRIAWLWRNRGYNFSYHVCGVATDKPVCIIAGRTFWNDANPRGWCIATCGKAWMVFVWLPYSATRGLRIYLGWKLRGKIDKPHENPRAMLVTHINPLKGKM